MSSKHYLAVLVLLLAGASVTMAQTASSNNDDDVVKVDRSAALGDYVNGQVIVKMKDGSPASVRRNAKGRFASAGIAQLDAVLQEFDVQQMEKLLPQEQSGRPLRKARAYNGDIVAEHDLSQLYIVTFDGDSHPGQTQQLVDRLQSVDAVEYAEPNYKLYTLDATIDGFSGGNPYATSQWYLEDYGVTQLWNKPIVNAKRPVIAILDTGVDTTHPDLVSNLWTNAGEQDGEPGYDNDHNGFQNDLHGWDFINNTATLRDYNMHGTHVAGIAAAANNGIGIVGANPRALIMPVTVMQSDGTGDVATIVRGVDYAVQNGATILNLSLGSYANSRALRQSLERAYQTCVIVAAAGNDGLCVNSDHQPRPCYGAAPMFPAAYSFVLGVQATQQGGGLAGFSNYDDNGANFSGVTTFQDPDGFNYELSAPGTNMLSTIPGGKYKVLQGTSMAAPLVAGAISALQMVKEYDTQEILWGDLLHTSNIAEAYAVKQRPAELDLMKVMYRERKELADETEADYSSDGEIDAGETVSLYPVIRTTFGAASNIKMYLAMGDEFEDASTVELITDQAHPVDFGLHLDAYGKGVSLNPLQLRVSPTVADNRNIKLKFVATCDESNVTYVGTFTIVVTNMVKINGLITEDRTLTADHVYLVNENLGIMKGATLTIEPGTRLEFAEGMGLSSFGKLVADGTPEKPIVFTGHNGASWAGVKTHSSEDMLMSYTSFDCNIFTNDDQTLFTLIPTEQTPNQFYGYRYARIYIKPGQSYKSFYITNYINPGDLTYHQELLTDPSYITPAVLQTLADFEEYCSQFPTSPTEEETWGQSISAQVVPYWQVYSNPRDRISYCRIEGYNASDGIFYPEMYDCVLTAYDSNYMATFTIFDRLKGERINVAGHYGYFYYMPSNLKYSNIVNNYNGSWTAHKIPSYSQLKYNNYFNNFTACGESGKYYGKLYSLGKEQTTPDVDHSDTPSYLGTSKESVIRPYIYEIGNAPNTYGTVDLSNMPTRPYAEAHGIVWKVVVNGKDAQDEYDELAPLGVGRHKFEVYFNRPMNKAVAPQISFGVRDPYTQNPVNEDGSWNDEGTIYTAYKTITGRTKSDGVNRIYVYGAEDNEYFEIPYEKTRFNVMINAAGSMATGFAAEAQMGRVELTWNNDENDFEDAMGFNLYRYTVSDEGVADTLRINENVIDVDATEYVDYDVTPGETYHYYYKVLSTDLQEYDVSNVVAATPLTSTLGDANGSGAVDVADVITTVNYASGLQPKPFIFEAADMNTDLRIDILDVIGIIRCILNPNADVKAAVESVATYTVEDGTLYVETPVALAGVQVQLALKNGQVRVAADLDGFEHVSAWLSDEDYLFLAYNLSGRTLAPGRHALLHLGDASIGYLRLSDTAGHNVQAVGDEATRVNRTAAEMMRHQGVYDLQGRKLYGGEDGTTRMPASLPKGVYIINGVKVVR